MVLLGVFVDDRYCVEPQDTIASALWVTREICSLLGLELEHSKEQPPAPSIAILGAFVQVGEGLLTASITAKRTEDYCASLKGILHRGNLSPAAAAKIRGKLGFSQSLVFGKYGRAMLHAFTTRQYSTMTYNLRTPLLIYYLC